MKPKIPWQKKWLRIGVISRPSGLSFLTSSRLPCDLIEIRLDYFPLDKTSLHTLKQQLQKRKYPVLLTLRSVTEGGKQKLTNAQRETILLDFLPVIDAIDLEQAHLASLAHLHRTLQKRKLPLVVSAHSFEKPFNNKQIVSRIRRMKKQSAAIYKIASRCDTVIQLITLLQNQIRFNSLPIALMGMGKLAPLSRQFLPLVGSKLVYGYLDAPTAPGQPQVKTLPVAH